MSSNNSCAFVYSQSDMCSSAWECKPGMSKSSSSSDVPDPSSGAVSSACAASSSGSMGSGGPSSPDAASIVAFSSICPSASGAAPSSTSACTPYFVAHCLRSLANVAPFLDLRDFGADGSLASWLTADLVDVTTDLDNSMLRLIILGSCGTSTSEGSEAPMGVFSSRVCNSLVGAASDWGQWLPALTLVLRRLPARPVVIEVLGNSLWAKSASLNSELSDNGFRRKGEGFVWVFLMSRRVCSSRNTLMGSV
mmetsp:Transcript_88850/g.250271  ORF Transcript_88850/g.250271 Transcript_88850/m.250271 type:complete len:251 (-) Transcript_88850:53-805(-)